MIDRLRQLLGYQMPRLGGPGFRLFQRYGPATVQTQLFSGIRATLNLRDLTQLGTFWQGERFERPTCPVLQKWLHDSSIFFDIGSNYGFFSFFAVSHQPVIRVHAFEPHPRTFELLQGIKTENHLDRITCWNCGLGNRSEKLDLLPGTEDLGHSTFGEHPGYTGRVATFPVVVRTFGEWRREQAIPLPARPEWLAKIDVEGFELRVLEGMREELAAKAFKGLVVEINPFTLAFCGTSPDAILDFMNGVGYHPVTAAQINPALSGECANYFFRPRSP